MPDVITSAKGLGNGLPIGACLCKEFLSNVLTAGTHGTTFGGNPVACAGALEGFKKVDNSLLTRFVKGEYIKSRLKDIDEIEEIRGMGLMLGIKLKTLDAREVAKIYIAKNGLMILTAKNNICVCCPRSQ